MDEEYLNAPALARSVVRDRARAAWWTAVLGALTVAALAALAFSLYVLDGLTTGVAAVLDPATSVSGPDGDAYVAAVVLAAVVVLVGGQVILRLLDRAVGASWPALLRGLAAAGAAGLVGGSAMLLRLGISPVDFVVAL